MENKNPLVSKRFWVGVLGVLTGLLGYFKPGLVPYLDPAGAVFLGIWTGAGLILNLVSKGTISLVD